MVVDAVEDLDGGEHQLAGVAARFDFVPGERGGHRGVVVAAQRVWAAVVFAGFLGVGGQRGGPGATPAPSWGSSRSGPGLTGCRPMARSNGSTGLWPRGPTLASIRRRPRAGRRYRGGCTFTIIIDPAAHPAASRRSPGCPTSLDPTPR